MKIDKKALAKKFGMNVRKARLALGWTQEDLAKHSDLQPIYVSFVERGERNITLKNIVKISRGLRVPPSNLVAVL